MMSRRIFVVWVNPLFRDSVLMLLKHPEVEYVGAAKNSEAVVETIMEVEADTILVEEMEATEREPLLDLFEQPEFKGRLVSLNLHDNRLQVYQREEWLALQPEDLLDVVLR